MFQPHFIFCIGSPNLQVQEGELSKAKSKHSGKDKQYEEVITGWRRKVYALLIQQKSAEIVSRNDINNLRQKISDHEDKLSSSEARADMLELSLRDKTAQMQMEVNHKQSLQEDLTQIQQVAECLDDQSRESMGHLGQLGDAVARWVGVTKILLKTFFFQKIFFKIHFYINAVQFGNLFEKYDLKKNLK